MYDQIYTLVIFPLLLLIGQTIIQTLNVITSRKINQRLSESEEKRAAAKAATDEKRAIEAKWREDMEVRMQKLEQCLTTQEKNVNLVLRGQISQMRSDVIHRTHRYLDDLGCASTEEKNAYEEEYKEYCLLCKTANVENEFVQSLHDQVMALPGRPDDD